MFTPSTLAKISRGWLGCWRLPQRPRRARRLAAAGWPGGASSTGTSCAELLEAAPAAAGWLGGASSRACCAEPLEAAPAAEGKGTSNKSSMPEESISLRLRLARGLGCPAQGAVGCSSTGSSSSELSPAPDS